MPENNSHILIVGGAGYIGSHTTRYFMEQGYSCVVLDNLSYGHKEAVQTPLFEQADLRDKASLEAVFAKYTIRAVVHFAAFIAVGESVNEPQMYYENNVLGTLNLLDVMLRHGVKDIVFSSTCAVYGNPQYTPLDEQHPIAPISPYAQTKRMVEQIMQDYHEAYGLRYIALRYFNAAGASQDGLLGESHHPETHLIPLVLQAIKGDRDSIQVFGTDYPTPDGTCLRDYIHIEDLARAHALALEKLSSFTGCLNLGTGIPTSVNEIITTAEKITGKPCPTRYAQRRPGDPAILYAANDKAQKILGWKPHYTNVESIIATAWQWETNKRY